MLPSSLPKAPIDPQGSSVQRQNIAFGLRQTADPGGTVRSLWQVLLRIHRTVQPSVVPAF